MIIYTSPKHKNKVSTSHVHAKQKDLYITTTQKQNFHESRPCQTTISIHHQNTTTKFPRVTSMPNTKIYTSPKHKNKISTSHVHAKQKHLYNNKTQKQNFHESRSCQTKNIYTTPKHKNKISTSHVHAPTNLYTNMCASKRRINSISK